MVAIVFSQLRLLAASSSYDPAVGRVTLLADD